MYAVSGRGENSKSILSLSKPPLKLCYILAKTLKVGTRFITPLDPAYELQTSPQKSAFQLFLKRHNMLVTDHGVVCAINFVELRS